MNFDQIIEEELGEARERIKSRVASLLLGGGPASPSAPPARVAPRVAAPKLPRLTGPGGATHPDTLKDADKAMAFINSNPGCFSREIAAHLGAAGCKDGPYMRAMSRLKSAGAVILRGEKTAAAWWPSQGGQTPPETAQVATPRALAVRNAAAVDVPLRGKKILRFLAGAKWRQKLELTDHFKDPKWGSKNAVQLALHRFVESGEVLKRPSKKTYRGHVLAEYRTA